MKKMLGGQKFASDTDVQSVVCQWLGQQPASFFASGIQKLVDRWDKCLNELGRYVEQEAQLMLTTGATRLAVRQGQQTWYHFGSVATFR